MSNPTSEQDTTGKQREVRVYKENFDLRENAGKIANMVGLGACAVLGTVKGLHLRHDPEEMRSLGFLFGGLGATFYFTRGLARSYAADYQGRLSQAVEWARDDIKPAVAFGAASVACLGASFIAHGSTPATAGTTPPAAEGAPVASAAPQGETLAGYTYLPKPAGNCVLPTDLASATDEAKLNFEQVLMDAGYDPGPVDGIIDGQTSAAVNNLQLKFHMSPAQAEAIIWNENDCSEAYQKLGYPWWAQP